MINDANRVVGRTFRLFLSLAAATILVVPFQGAAQSDPPEIIGEFDDEPMYSVLPADAIPAIREPEFLTGAEANSQMSPHEPVIGVVLDGEARAYSTWHLDAHEIVNDEISGTQIAATW